MQPYIRRELVSLAGTFLKCAAAVAVVYLLKELTLWWIATQGG